MPDLPEEIHGDTWSTRYDSELNIVFHTVWAVTDKAAAEGSVKDMRTFFKAYPNASLFADIGGSVSINKQGRAIIKDFLYEIPCRVALFGLPFHIWCLDTQNRRPFGLFFHTHL